MTSGKRGGEKIHWKRRKINDEEGEREIRDKQAHWRKERCMRRGK